MEEGAEMMEAILSQSEYHFRGHRSGFSLDCVKPDLNINLRSPEKISPGLRTRTYIVRFIN